MKRFLTLLAFVTLAITANAVIQSGTCGANVTFVLNDDGTLTISGSGSMSNSYSDSSPWISNRDKIIKVQIKDGVTSIGNYAFYKCTGLTSIEIPNSVTSIGSSAFSLCSSLTSIAIPNSVASIGWDAFYNCTSLNSVNIPNSVLSISPEAFYHCAALTSITIPNSVTSIGQYAFRYCYNLASVSIPNSVTSIGEAAFGNCEKLTSVYCYATEIPSTRYEDFEQFENCPLYRATLYVPASSLDAYKTKYPWSSFRYIQPLPALVSSISINAGSSTIIVGETETLTATVLPENAKDKTVTWSSSNPNVISVNANTGEITATGLGKSTITATAVDGSGVSGSCEITTVGANSYYDIEVGGVYYKINSTTKEATVTYKDGNYKSYSGEVSVPEKFTLGSVEYTVTGIGASAFRDCSNLTTIDIPNSVTSIGNYAFRACSNLTTIDIPNSVTSIGTYAFYDCSKLVSISVPNGVTSIGNYTFYGCSKLVSIDIPNSVTSIGNSAFYNCYSLTSINIPNGVTSIGNYTFNYCYGLTSINIPNGVTSIGDHAFRDCYGLTSVTIPKSVTTIGTGAFSNCKLSSLTVDSSNPNYCSEDNVLFNKNKTELISYAGLETGGYTIPNSVTKIGGYAFYYCYGLTSIEIPNSVTSIGTYAFYNCYSLTSINIPNGVKSIGSYAFGYCRKLQELKCFAREVPSTGSSVFTGVTLSNRILYVPEKSVEKYKAASQWKDWPTIIGFSETLNLTDGEAYTNEENKILDELTFKKSFPSSSAGKWNALYVPIKINVEDYANQLDFAEIYAFCATVDTNGDGSIDGDDENFLFVRPVTTGCIEPNIPYVVRPHDAKEYTIRSYDDILYAKAEGTIQFGTTEEDFTVIGIYEPFDVKANDNNYYVSSTGTLGYRTSGSVTINPNRWIMHRQPKGYGGGIDGSNNLGNEENPSAGAKEYRIITLDEDMDEATAIELINMQKSNKRVDNTIYTLDGRKVNDVKTLTNGIYIKNGKKYIVR